MINGSLVRWAIMLGCASGCGDSPEKLAKSVADQNSDTTGKKSMGAESGFHKGIELDQESPEVIAEKRKLVGEWSLVSDSFRRDEGAAVTIGNRTLIVNGAAITKTYKYLLDPTQSPARIDLIFLVDGKTEVGIPQRGIYMFAENQLTLSLGGSGPGVGNPFLRADSFTVPPNALSSEKWQIRTFRRHISK